MQNEIVYFKICDNIHEYKKIKQNYSPSSNIIKKTGKVVDKIEWLCYIFKAKCNKIDRLIINNKQTYIIYKINQKNEDNLRLLKKVNRKIKKIIGEGTSINKNIQIVLSKSIKKLAEKMGNKGKIRYINNIIENCKNSKELYKNYIVEIINSVIKLRKEIPEEQNIYILAQKNEIQYTRKIMSIISKYKTTNIVTKNVADFARLEKSLDDFDDMITILNNKRKSLAKAKYIINLDFSKDDVVQYNIYRTAIIFNLSPYKLENINGFDGNIINNVQINDEEETEYCVQDEYVCGAQDIHKAVANKIEEYKFCLKGNNGDIASLQETIIS